MDVRNWDAKTALAALFLLGYFALVYFLPPRLAGLSAEERDVIDTLLEPLGPVIGIIAFAIWRSSHADTLRAVAAGEALKSNAEAARAAVAGSSAVATTTTDAAARIAEASHETKGP